jgi:hypothetical protein
MNRVKPSSTHDESCAVALGNSLRPIEAKVVASRPQSIAKLVDLYDHKGSESPVAATARNNDRTVTGVTNALRGFARRTIVPPPFDWRLGEGGGSEKDKRGRKEM